MARSAGRKVPHEPTQEMRQMVQLHSSIGTPQDLMARILDIDEKTLRKYYRDELDLGLVKANAKMGGSLFNKGLAGDTAAQIFWMKTRAGWREKDDAQNVTINLPYDGWHIERAKPDTPETD